MSGAALPADGPDAALVRILRLFRLPYSQSSVTRAVGGHPRPDSLLALVEVAEGLGLEVKPYRADASALADLAAPLIVHFGDGGFDGGFGVVEAVSEDGFEVWDSARGLRLLSRDTFLEHWSGVVAVVRSPPSGVGGVLPYLRARLADRLWGSLAPPSVTSGPVAPFLRVALAVLVSLPLLVAVAGRPADARPAAAGLVLLSVLGLAVASRLSPSADGTAPRSRLCPRGRLFDCEGVLTSRYARIAGIPLGDVGIAFYGALLLLVSAAAIIPSGSAVWDVVALAYAASVPASILLLSVQLSMRRLCVLCLAVHAVNLSGAAIWWSSGDIHWPTSHQTGPILLFAAFFGLLLFLVVPYPRTGRGLERLAARHGRMSTSSFAGLAEVLTEPPTGVRGRECGIRLAGSGGAHELVVFVHPFCRGCGPVLREVEAIGGEGRVDVYVAVAPRTGQDRDRRLCEAVVAVGVGLGPRAMLGAYETAKGHAARLLDDPVGGLADELSEARSCIEAGLEEARRLVGRADVLAAEHVEGTPAVFFDSRRYEGWLSHLAFLLERHPELLEPIRTSDPRGTDETTSA